MHYCLKKIAAQSHVLHVTIIDRNKLIPGVCTVLKRRDRKVIVCTMVYHIQGGSQNIVFEVQLNLYLTFTKVTSLYMYLIRYFSTVCGVYIIALSSLSNTHT